MVEWSDESLALGWDDIDNHHRQFVELLNGATGADNTAFKEQYEELFAHLEQHFAEEEALMDSCNFSASAEHKGEHRRVLGEMKQFKRQLERGRSQMARAYITENLPGWFKLHVTTMDSALVAQLMKS